ncbi:MAG: DUF3418 domain-containing protein, partial [Brachybacterium sp.]|nr:DUF3418 domain-containing protein [Brachybacterium sp.]
DLSSSAFRREVRSEHLHYLRIREWWDLHAQLRDMAKDADLRAADTQASPVQIHQALLAGLLSHVGLYQERTREYSGARGARFALWPGSALAKKRPDLVMVAELVETSRLWGRIAARIDPDWVEEIGAHAVKRTYSAPHWSTKRAAAMAHEKVTLYGVPIIADRVTSYGRVDPVQAREIFLQHALIEGQWRTRHHFFRDNTALIERIEELQTKARRRDLLVGDEALFRFYDERIPATVVSGRHFDAWWKKQRHETPDLLTLRETDLLREDTSSEDLHRQVARDFPDTWTQGDLTLPLTYSTEGGPADGVTATIPLASLNRLTPRGFDWLVPGLRTELVTELIRSLPKPIRRHLVPAPERAKTVAATLHDDDPDAGEPFVEAVADELVALPGVPDDLPLYGEEFDPARLPAHLRMHFRVVDQTGRQIGVGDDLAELQKRLAARIRTTVADQGESLARRDVREFPADGVPRVHESTTHGVKVTGYPALVTRRAADGTVDRIDLQVLASADEQTARHAEGITAMIDRELDPNLSAVLASLPNPTKMAVASSPYPTTHALLADASRAATEHLLAEAGDPAEVRTVEQYRRALEHVRVNHRERAAQAVRDAAAALAGGARLQREVGRVSSLAVLQQLTQIRDHAAGLLGEQFISRTGIDHLADLERYLRAAEVRLEKLQQNPQRDQQLAWQVADLEQLWERERGRLTAAQRRTAEAAEIPWMLEELRVGLFAQAIGTRYPVSDKRIRRAIAAL